MASALRPTHYAFDLTDITAEEVSAGKWKPGPKFESHADFMVTPTYAGGTVRVEVKAAASLEEAVAHMRVALAAVSEKL